MRAWNDNPVAGMLTPAIKWLLIVNAAVFALQILFSGALFEQTGLRLESILGLRPASVVERGWVWQLVTYMFLHGGFFHLLFNMFVLWMFGSEIERLWGSRRFLDYYFICGLGAAALSFVFDYGAIIIGASGAVLGVLVAFAMLFPDRYIYLWFLIPIRAKFFVAGLVAIELIYLYSASGAGIARAAHIGGMAVGYAYLRWGSGSPLEALTKRWRRRRLRVIEGGASRRKQSEARRAESEIDRILDKISQQGLDSLTREEARILDEASRQNRNDS